MHVYHSNRLEVLAAKLTSLIASDPAEPLTPERIVVPHQTMGGWLQLEIAREMGVAANLDFQQPAAFAWSMLHSVIPDLPKAQGFAPDKLRWHLFALLPDFANTADAAAVQRFLADGDERKRFELADKLAGVFDRCINFRSDWIRDWEQGAAPHWQARLWQLLVTRVSERHWVHALDALEQKLTSGTGPADWPRRAFIFAVSALSPSYLQFLERLAAHIEWHVFLFNPSAEYWSDLRSEKEIRYRARDHDPQTQHFEEGNPLLAAWGRAGRFAFESLIAQQVQEQPCFQQPDNTSRLAMVQTDIQEVRDPATARGSTAVAPDHSIQIHCCHSAMREAEVLHDRLLDLLEHNAVIEPADVLILTPNPALYGPLIAAVFEAEGRIPVVLSRFRAADSPTARALFDLLSLPDSRHGVEAMLAPLDAPSLQARFGIGENSLPMIRDWVSQAGIRRGIAADGGEQAPAMPGNSWNEGLQRLVMGYATGDTEALALGIAPCPIRNEGGFAAGEEDYATLGKFIAYCHAALELHQRVENPRTAKQWTLLLRRLVKQFFDDGSSRGAYRPFEAMREAAKEFEEVSKLIDNFAAEAGRIDCSIPFDVMRQTLSKAALDSALGAARLADGATIGPLASGQVLPAKVVCVVGMNGDAFPRNPPHHTFDLVEQDQRRPGDRDVRHEDRFAFLEALLAARNAFLVSYTGRDQRNDAEMPPAVVVDELADYLATRFPPPDAAGEPARSPQPATGCWPVVHPLQPFSPRYFNHEENALFSYSQTMLNAATALCRQDRTSRHRFATRLPEPEPARRAVSLDELALFFADPARGFLQQRFGVRLREAEQTLDEVEPLQLDGLQRWSLRQQIYDRSGATAEQGADLDAVRSMLLASGALPHGSFGELAYDEAQTMVGALKQKLMPYAETLAIEPVPLALDIGQFRLTGVLPNVGTSHMVWWRNGKLRAQDRIAIRLRQLAWVAAGKRPMPAMAVFMDRTKATEKVIPAPDLEEESIEQWLEVWWQGLTEPLRFFPESSIAWCEQMARGRKNAESQQLTRQKAIQGATAVWLGNPFQSAPAECQQPGNQLVWDLDGDQTVLDEEFGQLAERLLLPMCQGMC